MSLQSSARNLALISLVAVVSAALVACRARGTAGSGTGVKTDDTPQETSPADVETGTIDGNKLDTASLEEELFGALEDIAPEEDWEARCPEEVKPAEGGQFKCVVIGEKVRWVFEVTQLNDEGKVRVLGTPRYEDLPPGSAVPDIRIKKTTTIDLV